MFRQIITPQSPSFTIQLPAEMVGKEVEVIAFEIEQPVSETETIPCKSINEVKKRFEPFRADLKDFTFDREEANNYRGYAD
jgi:hypothetical protein